MKDAIGYLRVSTREQGRSGLGLAAQRYGIETFGALEEFKVKSWYRTYRPARARTHCCCGLLSRRRSKRREQHAAR